MEHETNESHDVTDSHASDQASEKAKKKLLKKRHASASMAGSAHLPLELFQLESSPDCQAVRSRLCDLGLDYICRTVPTGNALKSEQVVQAGGSFRLPLLMDHSNGTKLYGATAILLYLEGEYGKLPESRILRVAHRLNVRLEQNRKNIAWAFRNPVERIRTVRSDAKEVFHSLGDSFRVIRETMQMSEEPEAVGDETFSAPLRTELSEREIEQDLKEAR